MSLFILSLNNMSRDELHFANFVRVSAYLHEYNNKSMNNNIL